MSNPFKAGIFQGRQLYHSNGPDRIDQARGFNLKECEAGLQVPGVQKTVTKALNSRINKIKASK
jgi:hypothetical protein